MTGFIVGMMFGGLIGVNAGLLIAVVITSGRRKSKWR